jgi:hypothetical protein
MTEIDRQRQYQRMADRAHEIIESAGDVWEAPRPDDFNLMEEAIYMPHSSFVTTERSTAAFSGGLTPVVHMGEIGVRRDWPDPEPRYYWYEDGSWDKPFRWEERCKPKLLSARMDLDYVNGDGYVHVRTAARLVGEREAFEEPDPGFTSFAVTEVRRYGRDPHTQYRFALTSSIGNLLLTRVVHTGGISEAWGRGNWQDIQPEMAIEQGHHTDPITNQRLYAPLRRRDFSFDDLTGMPDVPLEYPLEIGEWEKLLDYEFSEDDILLHEPDDDEEDEDGPDEPKT